MMMKKKKKKFFFGHGAWHKVMSPPASTFTSSSQLRLRFEFKRREGRQWTRTLLTTLSLFYLIFSLTVCATWDLLVCGKQNMVFNILSFRFNATAPQNPSLLDSAYNSAFLKLTQQPNKYLQYMQNWVLKLPK